MRSYSMLFRGLSALSLGALILVAGCAPDISDTDFYSLHPDPDEIGPGELVELGSETVDGVVITLLTRDTPHTGVNELYVRASEGGVPVSEATTSAVARVESRSAPVLNSTTAKADDEDLIPVRVMFLQPKSEVVQWDVEVRLSLASKSVAAAFDVTVEDGLWMQELERPGEDTRYYVTWIAPVRPSTGDAPFELAIYRQTEDAFVPVEDAVLDLYPYMDMGAGEGHSTPYEAPVAIGDGHYVGSVNFIMSGGWDMTVYVQFGHDVQRTIVFGGFTVY